MTSRALVLALLVAACPAAKPQARLCTPNNNVFCRCPDLRDGTKKCSEDGASFSECACLGELAPVATPTDPWVATEHPVAAVPVKDLSAQCPGFNVTVDPLSSTKVSAETQSVATAERVYEVIPTATGALKIRVKGQGGLDTSFCVQKDSCAPGKARVCVDASVNGEAEVITLNVIAERKYYVFVGARNAGAFDLDLSVVPGPFCGDGSIAPSELCDDGNDVAKDGCGDHCMPEGDPVALGQCSGGGMPVHVWADTDAVWSGSTKNYPNTAQSLFCEFGADAGEHVYHAFIHVAGELDVQLLSEHSAGLTVRRKSCDDADERWCADNDGSSSLPNVEMLAMSVSAGEEFWIVVDGADAQTGDFELTFRMIAD